MVFVFFTFFFNFDGFSKFVPFWIHISKLNLQIWGASFDTTGTPRGMSIVERNLFQSRQLLWVGPENDQFCWSSSGAVGGKTGKTTVLPGFCKIERGGGSGGALPYYVGLSWPVRHWVQCSICADIVGVSEKVQNYADVIYEWSPTGLAKSHKPSLRDETAKYIISLYTESPFNILKATLKYKIYRYT